VPPGRGGIGIGGRLRRRFHSGAGAAPPAAGLTGCGHRSTASRRVDNLAERGNSGPPRTRGQKNTATAEHDNRPLRSCRAQHQLEFTRLAVSPHLHHTCFAADAAIERTAARAGVLHPPRNRLRRFGAPAAASGGVPARSSARPRDALYPVAGETMSYLLRADFHQRLQVAQLDGAGVLNHFRRHGQLGGRVYSPSAWMILARRSRSPRPAAHGADHLLGQSTCLTSTMVTFTPQVECAVQDGLQRSSVFSRWLSSSSSSTSPARCAAWSAPVAKWHTGNWNLDDRQRGSSTRK